MTSLVYSLLSHSWSGLVIAGIVAGLGWLIVRAAARLHLPPFRFVGYALYGLAGLLTAASGATVVRITGALRRHPPMGKLVDVGGYRMHILAEGDAHGGPTLIWIPGGHWPGLALYHLHKVMRQETRSILFDRPGTGWSDIGPFPRRTAREAEELATLLENAGERGPFVLIGHSYGGLLAANFARRHLAQIAAVVLLDASPPDAFVYPPGRGAQGLTRGARINEREGLAKLFGIRFDSFRSLWPWDQLVVDISDAMDATSAGPASDWAQASIRREFDADRIASTAPDLMVYDGELADIPVFVVVPDGDIPKTVQQLDLSEADKQRSLKFLERMRLRYLSTSSRSTLIHPPAGTGHLFPYEAPDFVVGVVRRVLAEIRVGQSPGLRNHP